MNINIEATDLSGDYAEHNYRVELPPICPVCVKGAFPHHLASYFSKPKESILPVISSMFFCPICENLFMGTYFVEHDYELKLHSVIPYPSRSKKFSDNIEKISPDFCKIYNEAYKAEQQELFEICGMGYRKALEFLIKDYALSLNPNDKEDISKKPLSKCITDHLDSADLKALAIASAWIGNEETHYVRTMTNYGPEDLKTFINAAVSFIDMKLNISKANSLINSRPNSLKK